MATTYTYTLYMQQGCQYKDTCCDTATKPGSTATASATACYSATNTTDRLSCVMQSQSDIGHISTALLGWLDSSKKDYFVANMLILLFENVTEKNVFHKIVFPNGKNLNHSVPK